MSPTHKRFDSNEIPQSVHEQIEAKMAEAATFLDSDSDDFGRLLMESRQIVQQEAARQAALYPENPPNDVCNHALIRGYLIPNAAGLSKGDLNPFFALDHEQVSVWTHTQSQYSSLLSSPSPSVHDLPLWRNAGTLLRLAFALDHSFESVPDPVGYDWIYRFDPAKDLKQHAFLDNDSTGRISGQVNSIREIAGLASVIELLHSDETFFVSTTNLLASFHSHWFFLICALSPYTHRKHPIDELPFWEMADMIPRMEAAIVQATRSVEAILGKPGKNRERTTARWTQAIPLPPDELFEMKSMTYLDYYYELFGVRAEAAHSFGRVSADMTRQITIEAQSFAALIHQSYFEKDVVKHDEALRRLNFNVSFVESESQTFSTPFTKDDPDYEDRRTN